MIRINNRDFGICVECGGCVGRLVWDKDEEGWFFCDSCGLVENDGSRQKLMEMGVGVWFDLVKKLRPGIRIKDLRKIDVSERFGFLRKIMVK